MILFIASGSRSYWPHKQFVRRLGLYSFRQLAEVAETCRNDRLAGGLERRGELLAQSGPTPSLGSMVDQGADTRFEDSRDSTKFARSGAGSDERATARLTISEV